MPARCPSSNVLHAARATGLPKPLVANVTQLVTLDRDALTEGPADSRRRT